MVLEGSPLVAVVLDGYPLPLRIQDKKILDEWEDVVHGPQSQAKATDNTCLTSRSESN